MSKLSRCRSLAVNVHVKIPKHYSSGCKPSILLPLQVVQLYVYTYTTYNSHIATLQTMTLIRETLTSG